MPYIQQVNCSAIKFCRKFAKSICYTIKFNSHLTHTQFLLSNIRHVFACSTARIYTRGKLTPTDAMKFKVKRTDLHSINVSLRANVYRKLVPQAELLYNAFISLCRGDITHAIKAVFDKQLKLPAH